MLENIDNKNKEDFCDVKISIRDVVLIFGEKKAKTRALKMLDEGKDIAAIREKTGATVAVNDVSLDINEGEMFVIVGLSGSGKSSLIRCINKLNTPTKGEILIDGEDICKYNKHKLMEFRRKKVAMIFQHFGLLSHRTVIQNVEYGPEIRKEDIHIRRAKAKDAIDMVGLEGWENYYPRQLSGGMKQRVGIARALTNEPEILLMDEPFSALDPLIRRDMQNELLSMEDYIDKTIIFITHDMNEAFRIGDRIALLKDGELIQVGRTRDFFENPTNDYVKSFIQDVDISRVMRVKTAMRKPDKFVSIGSNREEIIKLLNEKKRDFCFVIEENRNLAGYITKEDLENSNEKIIDKLLRKDHKKITQNSFLNEVWSKLDESDYDVAVVDSRNRFVGLISYEEAVNALSI